MVGGRRLSKLTGISTASRFAAIAAVIGVSACAIVDKFGERVVDYNLQAESTKNVGILLNVMRSAYRRPLQFSDLSQVSGSAAASAMASFTLPFGVNSVANYGATPSASMSGGPTFTVANLDSQAFYQGILAPIDPKIMALFLKKGVPELLVLTLLVDTIDIIQDNGDKKPTTDYSIYNNVGGGGQSYKDFESNLIALWRAGLDMEEVSSVKRVGPPLSDADMKNLRGVADLAAQKLTIAKFDVKRDNNGVPTGTDPDSGLSVDELKRLPPNWAHFFLVEKKSDTSFQFCFQPDKNGDPKPLLDENYKKSSINVKYKDVNGEYTSFSIDKIDASALCGAPKKTTPPDEVKRSSSESDLDAESLGIVGTMSEVQTDRQPGGAKSPKYKMSLRPRSTADVFWYLGEIARSELAINGGKVFAPTIWTGKDKGSEPLFTVSDQAPDSTLVSESYLGRTYWIPMSGPSGDRSGEVMELVKELINLNSAAKDLPAPAVISIIR